MKRLLALAAFSCGICLAQAPADCKPNSLNIPEAKYPCIFPDGRAMFRVVAPNAQSVRVSIGNLTLTKGPDGIWGGTTAQPLVEGFHYYSLIIDGATVADPSTHTFFGSGWQNSGIEIPAPDADFYAHKEVPHGRVAEQWYFSKVTGKWRRCFVYMPPDYEKSNRRYPVLYLQHGWGEDETGWFVQGHMSSIMDNLIAEKKAKPMLVVMDNLNAVKPGASASLFAARGLVPDPSNTPPAPPAARGAMGAARAGGRGGFDLSAFTDMMIQDLIPMIERTYRAIPNRESRAMAGLSMGGMQTKTTTMANLDKFSHIGLFSGGNIQLSEIKDPATFKKQVKVVFFSHGAAEGGAQSKGVADELKKAGINAVYYQSPRTAHEWLTWRRSLYQFAPLLFQ